jgi:hypothetical protein
MRRGMGGEWAWLALAGAAFVLRRTLNDSGGKISRLEVRPGEQLLITVRDAKAPVVTTAGTVADAAEAIGPS